METENKAALALMAIILIIVGTALLLHAETKQEIADCMQWNEEASSYTGFYLTEWQDQQCRAHGIIIKALVMEN